jgi:hypothetical protein
MAGGEVQRGMGGQNPQQWNVDGRQNISQQGPMPLAPHPIQHDPRQIHPWRAIVAKPAHQGSQRGTLAGGLHHQHHRQIQQVGHLGRTPVTGGASPIKQTHHPLHQHGVRPAPVPLEGLPHPWLATEQGIKIAAWPARHLAQQLGVEVVGPHLEGLQGGSPMADPGRQDQA